MPARDKWFSIRRLVKVALLVAVSIVAATMIGFRVQSLLFERKVHSVLWRLGQFYLDNTSEEEVLRSLPELKPGILWSFTVDGRSDDRCPGDACYVLRVGNLPDGMVFRFRRKLEYRQDWIFKTAYLLGHRYRTFASYVEIRGKKVSRYEYSLAVTDQEYPLGELVGVQVLGADRASFPRGYAAIEDYDEIRGIKGRVPGNKPTTMLWVAFTPEAQREDVRSAFDVHLACAWNCEGCSATKQILPGLWKREEKQKTERNRH